MGSHTIYPAEAKKIYLERWVSIFRTISKHNKYASTVLTPEDLDIETQYVLCLAVEKLEKETVTTTPKIDAKVAVLVDVVNHYRAQERVSAECFKAIDEAFSGKRFHVLMKLVPIVTKARRH